MITVRSYDPFDFDGDGDIWSYCGKGVVVSWQLSLYLPEFIY